MDTVFGYPGGTILNIYDALYEYKDSIRHVLTSHEQGAAHAADGYARSTGKVGVVIAILVVVLLWAMLKWTRFGRNLYAVGGNSESALMLGINVQRTQFFAYVLCGVLAGIAGFCYLLHTGAGNASNATAAEMQAIASSIIGGTLLSGGVGSVIGTLFGVLSLKTINIIVVASGLREPYWQSITTGLMLAFFIVLQSVILDQRKKKLGNMAG